MKVRTIKKDNERQGGKRKGKRVRKGSRQRKRKARTVKKENESQ